MSHGHETKRHVWNMPVRVRSESKQAARTHLYWPNYLSIDGSHIAMPGNSTSASNSTQSA